MNFRKVNNITGWIVGAIACLVYILTREATGSFWDCGEFVASAYKGSATPPSRCPDVCFTWTCIHYCFR